jgi:hypothetical protein
MRKNIIPTSSAFVLPLLLLLTGCTKQNVDYGPCKFAPPESKFPVFPGAYCNECYFNLNINNKEYSFAGNQFETYTTGSGPGWEPERNILVGDAFNSFFNFYFVSPPSDELLNNSIGVITPLLESTAIARLNYSPPPVSVALGIYNYCEDFFEPVPGDVTQSYHQLTKAEFIESYYLGSIDGSIEEYQKHNFYCYGEINATFWIDGEMQSATASYKVKVEIWEKL